VTTCYINPAVPTEAVLDRTIGIRDIAYPGGGLAIFLLTAFLAVHSFKLIGKSKEEVAA